MVCTYKILFLTILVTIKFHIQVEARTILHGCSKSHNNEDNTQKKCVITTEEVEDTYFIPQTPPRPPIVPHYPAAMIPHPIAIIPAVATAPSKPAPKPKSKHRHGHDFGHILVNKNSKHKHGHDSEHVLVNKNPVQDKYEQHEKGTSKLHGNDDTSEHEDKETSEQHEDKDENTHRDHEPIVKSYRDIGCYKDSHPRAVPSLEGSDSLLGGYYKTRTNAVEECSRIAKARGYEIFTIQNGGFCSSGPNAHNTFQTYGPAKNCRHGRGGAWASDVYIFNDYVYEVTVSTGVEQKEETAAKVAITLFGSLGQSKSTPLSSNPRGPNKRLFRSGKVDKFAVRSIPLGDLTRIHMCHDATDVDSEWYLEKVSIKDPKNKIYIFPCNCWLTKDKDKGMKDRNILPAIILDSGPFKYLGCFPWTNDGKHSYQLNRDNYLDGHPSSTFGKHEYILERCADESRRKGSMFFGVHNSNHCVMSSAELQDTYNTKTRTTSCHQDGTGGASSIAVYTFVNHEPLATTEA